MDILHRCRAAVALRLAAVAMLFCVGAPEAGATTVQVVGQYGYSTSGLSNVTITVEEILNASSTATTGTLRLEFWLSKTPLAGGVSGYRVATYQISGSSNGRLGPRQYFS